MAKHRYDMAIVGSGGAAFAAAIRASELGARVAMIERGTLGGTCVNVGCVPSKTLLRAGEIYRQAARHPFAGLATRAGPVDLAAAVAQKDTLIAELREEKYEQLIDAYGWDLIPGEARFHDPHLLAVREEMIHADRILIATGATPAVPPIAGLAATPYLTSTSALSLSGVPRRLVVIGAGYVALELGQLFQRLGSQVTLVQRTPRLLPAFEPEVAATLQQALESEGLRVVTGVRYERVEHGASGFRVRVLVDGQPLVLAGDALLVAAGRAPSTTALEADGAGVALDARGAVVVDQHLCTTNPRVYAAGDVTLGPQFVYVAAYEGALAAENALTSQPRPLDLRTVPSVAFTSPAIAMVGMTSAQAEAAGLRVKTALLPAGALPRARVNHDPHVLFKLVADADSDRLLGAHVVADHAGEVIYAATIAVKLGLRVADLAGIMAPYLTMAEGLRLAAQAFDRDIAKLSCCAS